MSEPEPPSCAWCDAADSLTEVIGRDTRVYECSCCSQLTRMDGKTRPQRVESKTDLLGNEMFEP